MTQMTAIFLYREKAVITVTAVTDMTQRGPRKAGRLSGERRTSEMNEISHLCGIE